MDNKWIYNENDLSNLVQCYGFLPLFKNKIEGFSVEEHTPSHLWFSDHVDGPWEWKGPVASNGKCVYGKFFNNKTGFISIEWFKDFLNYRRDGYDFDARFNDKLASYDDLYIWETLTKHYSLSSKLLKEKCNYGKGGNKGFETKITRLQMQTYVIIGDFDYNYTKEGKRYGWGIARYTTPEYLFGEEYVCEAYTKDPKESYQCMQDHLMGLFPQATEKQIRSILG